MQIVGNLVKTQLFNRLRHGVVGRLRVGLVDLAKLRAMLREHAPNLKHSGSSCHCLLKISVSFVD